MNERIGYVCNKVDFDLFAHLALLVFLPRQLGVISLEERALLLVVGILVVVVVMVVPVLWVQGIG